MEKQEKKERKLLTENRMTTVNKRETSFEGLVSQMENGENGIYGLIANDKNQIFRPKVKKVTQEELEKYPCLRQLGETIAAWEEKLKKTEGKDAFIIKNALIEMRKDHYLILNSYRKPLVPMKLVNSKHYPDLDENVHLDDAGRAVSEGVSLISPEVCSAVMCNYSKLKQDSYGNFESDLWYLIYDFELISDKALEDYPMYKMIMESKINGMSNAQIQEEIQKEFGINHTVEYISSLWRKKIPALIASAAEDQYLDWYFLNVEYGKYKKCSCCGQIKLAHNKYFSKNNTSKDGFYSRCKKCRNKKKGG